MPRGLRQPDLGELEIRNPRQRHGTLIAANLIGTDGSGSGALPNGTPSTPGAGVRLGFASGGPYVGEGFEAAGGPGNTIAFNEGPGIFAANAATRASIFANSIHSNVGLGIEYGEGEPAPPPSLGSAEGLSGSSTVSGTLAGEPGKSYFVDFYANEVCDPSGSGEGRTYIGTEGVAVGGGPAGFEATGLDPLPAGQSVITATASPEDSSTSTSVFSACLGATFPPPAPPVIPPLSSGTPPPVNGKSVAVEPVAGSGPIFVRVPGSKRFRRLRKGEAIPVGSIVNSRRGKVRLTSVDANGVTQTGVFFGGVFQVAQRKGNGLVVLRLRGHFLRSCRSGKARRSGADSSRRRRRKARRLWGSGKGKFRTKGNYGAASVRGTVWLTEDRCKGTLFKVRKGTVDVRDFVKKKTIAVRAPRGYFVKRRPR